jgi:RNA polymerase sigma factor (TIGR02999 family)
MSTQPPLTDALLAAHAGARDRLDALLPLVYEELHRIARHHLRREAEGHTLSTTELVHEAYLRLVDQDRVQWIDRAHFLAVAARAMRRILVDHARRRLAGKRGGALRPVSLDEVASLGTDDRAEILLTLDEALSRLAALDPRLEQVVECRFFGGLTEAEAAAALGVTDRTVRRDWVKAKGWLYRELEGAP